MNFDLWGALSRSEVEASIESSSPQKSLIQELNIPLPKFVSVDNLLEGENAKIANLNREEYKKDFSSNLQSGVDLINLPED